MKKYIITLLALFISHFMTAQTDGCLIIKEYSPDEWRVIDESFNYVDMDDNGEWDFRYYVFTSSSFMSAPELWAKNGCCFHIVENQNIINYNNVNTFVDIYQPFNDTSLIWSDPFDGNHIYPEIPYYGEYHLDTMTFKAGIRNGQEGKYYYGWMEAYAVVTYNYDSVWFYLARTCYCTIPNYPLRWGQTSLTTGFEENATNAFATIHPNPTTGLVTITGKALKQAEVLNTLGQCVATAQGKGEMLQIDIANLPTGIYFFRITDEEGRKCVRKVVKE